MRFPVIPPLIACIFFSWALEASAQNPKKDKKANQERRAWLNRITTDPPGPHQKLRPMELSYALSWKKRVKAGLMDFEITEPYPGVYLSKASGKSIGLARALFPYDFSGTSQTNANTLKPLTFDFTDKLKSKTHKYSILFQPSQMITQTDLTDHKTGTTTPYRHAYRFKQDVGLDLMSSVLYLRSQALTDRQKVSLVTATFNKPYLTEFTVIGREKKRFEEATVNAIKLDVKISKIHGNMTIEPYTKIERATVWISDDEYRVPLELNAKIFIGYINAQLTKRKFL